MWNYCFDVKSLIILLNHTLALPPKLQSITKLIRMIYFVIYLVNYYCYTARNIFLVKKSLKLYMTAKCIISFFPGTLQNINRHYLLMYWKIKGSFFFFISYVKGFAYRVSKSSQTHFFSHPSQTFPSYIKHVSLVNHLCCQCFLYWSTVVIHNLELS